jgi:hypothetical protein
MILGLLNWLSHAKMYTKIDLCEAYNLMHVRKGDKWKTTLWTHYGHFKYVVMPFDLRNAHVILQHLMNYEFFNEYLDDFVVCYINHIFIFFKNMEDDEWYVCIILNKLMEVKLYTKLKKYEFH